jgi:hypothetical protein
MRLCPMCSAEDVGENVHCQEFGKPLRSTQSPQPTASSTRSRPMAPLALGSIGAALILVAVFLPLAGGIKFADCMPSIWHVLIVLPILGFIALLMRAYMGTMIVVVIISAFIWIGYAGIKESDLFPETRMGAGGVLMIIGAVLLYAGSISGKLLDKRKKARGKDA